MQGAGGRKFWLKSNQIFDSYFQILLKLKQCEKNLSLGIKRLIPSLISAE